MMVLIGHIARINDNRWTLWLIEWRPWDENRSRDRAFTRQRDDMKHVIRTDQIKLIRRKTEKDKPTTGGLRRRMNHKADDDDDT